MREITTVIIRWRHFYFIFLFKTKFDAGLKPQMDVCAGWLSRNIVRQHCHCYQSMHLWNHTVSLDTKSKAKKILFFLTTKLFYPYSLNPCCNCMFTLSANSAWSVHKLFTFSNYSQTFYALKNIAHNSLCVFSILNWQLATWPLTSFFLCIWTARLGRENCSSV